MNAELTIDNIPLSMTNSSPIGELDQTKLASNYKICDIKNESKIINKKKTNDNGVTVANNHSENIMDIPNKTKTMADTNDIDQNTDKKDNTDIEHNTSDTSDEIQNNRKRVRQQSRKLTKILQEHHKMLRTNWNKNKKHICKCKCLSGFTNEKYLLTISNLPKSWSYIDIKNFIETVSGCPVDEMQIMENSGAYEIVQLTFLIYNECKQVMDKLFEKDVEGTKLCMVLKVVKDETDNVMQSDLTAKADSPAWRPDLDVWEIDPTGLYGLKPGFLKSLGIEPPIDKWVHVSNFRCDKSELRDILEMAGRVLMCTVVTNHNRYAKVMYSHPLEAVQAVSMLNGQQFYGSTLKLELDRCPNDTIVLPRGLDTIGLGLGDKGKPLRNVVKHYTRYINNETSSINPLLFSDIEDIRKCCHYIKVDRGQETEVSKEEMTQFGPASIQTKNVTELFEEKDSIGSDASTPANVDEINPNARSLSSNSNRLSNQGDIKIQNAALGHGVARSQVTATRPSRSEVAVARNLAPAVNPNFCSGGPRSGYSPRNVLPVSYRPGLGPVAFNMGCGLLGADQNAGFIRSGQLAGHSSYVKSGGVAPMGSRPGVLAVQLTNLPLTTTFPLLYERLSTCGQVVALQFTTPGCAVASFANPVQAETCIRDLTGTFRSWFMFRMREQLNDMRQTNRKTNSPFARSPLISLLSMDGDDTLIHFERA